MNWFAAWFSKIPNLIVLAILALALVAIGFWQVQWDDIEGACAPTKFVRQCYMVSEAVCNIAMEKLDKECRETLKRVDIGPGRLVHPILRNCIELKYGRIFPYMRNAGSACDERKKQLDDWAKTNADF